MNSASFAFGGGMALAAYHGGVFEAACSNGFDPAAVAGSSAGAITCAIVAGNAPERRLEKLKTFWRYADQDGSLRRGSAASGWTSVVARRVFGEPGQFEPRNPIANLVRFRSVYALDQMERKLKALVDFDLLNTGPVRVCIVTTDIQSGEPVVFDNRKGERISMDHLLASCGFLPEFETREINGRVLGDGGLSLNAPFDPLLEDEASDPVFISDLFARDGERPTSLAAAAERKNDLLFGNQTILRLQARLRDEALSRRQVFLLSYRRDAPEPGAEKPYDYSAEAIGQRWRAGRLDMQEAIAVFRGPEERPALSLIRRRAT